MQKKEGQQENDEIDTNIYILNKPPFDNENRIIFTTKFLRTSTLVLASMLLTTYGAILTVTEYLAICYSFTSLKVHLFAVVLIIKISAVSLACFIVFSSILGRKLTWFAFYTVLTVIGISLQLYLYFTYQYLEVKKAFNKGMATLTDERKAHSCGNEKLVINIQDTFGCCGWNSYDEYADKSTIAAQCCIKERTCNVIESTGDISGSFYQEQCNRKLKATLTVPVTISHIFIVCLEALLEILILIYRRYLKKKDNFDQYLTLETKSCINFAISKQIISQQEGDREKEQIQSKIRQACNTQRINSQMPKTYKVLNLFIRLPKTDKEGTLIEKPQVTRNPSTVDSKVSSVVSKASNTRTTSVKPRKDTKEKSTTKKKETRNKSKVKSNLQEPEVTKEQVNKRKQIMKEKRKSFKKSRDIVKVEDTVHTESAKAGIQKRIEVVNYLQEESILPPVTSPAFKVTRKAIEAMLAEAEKKIDDLDINKAQSLLGIFTSEINFEENSKPSLTPIQIAEEKAAVSRINRQVSKSRLATFTGPSSWVPSPDI